MSEINNDYMLYLAYIVYVLDDFKSSVISKIANKDKELWNQIFKIIPCNIDRFNIISKVMMKFNLLDENVSMKKNFEILEEYLDKNFFNKKEGTDNE